MSCNCNKRNPNGWNIKDCDTDTEAINGNGSTLNHHHHHCCCCNCNHNPPPRPRPHSNCSCTEQLISQSRIGDMESCRDFDGDMDTFETCSRNRFWPEFSHPRFICCKDLYSEC